MEAEAIESRYTFEYKSGNRWHKETVMATSEEDARERMGKKLFGRTSRIFLNIQFSNVEAIA